MSELSKDEQKIFTITAFLSSHARSVIRGQICGKMEVDITLCRHHDLDNIVCLELEELLLFRVVLKPPDNMAMLVEPDHASLNLHLLCYDVA